MSDNHTPGASPERNPPRWLPLESTAEFRRYNQAASTLGRWQLALYVLSKKLAWYWVVSGASMLKRAVDVVLSGLALIWLSPLFALIAIFVKLHDRGPVIFAQTRVGQFGRPFRLLKFRSMHVDAEQRLRDVLRFNELGGSVTFKLRQDPRLTPVGRFLRKWSLDELPQLWNVFRGEMSLVGPRPALPREVARYSPLARRRLLAKPGITCLWQVGGRSEISFSGQVALDLEYIESQSLFLDLKILLKTIPAVISGKGAC
jgi:lipopolysaccharide/colanic/teichoic acid biosynthesis glycosyltransferase